MTNNLFSILTILIGVVSVLGPLGAIAAIIFAPAIALPVIRSAIGTFLACRWCVLIAAVLVACVASYWIGRTGAYNKGVDDTVERVARGDAKVVDRARHARAKLQECREQGLRVDQTTGACR
jgi:uncharacterized membrane protein